jgi:cytochrome P450
MIVAIDESLATWQAAAKSSEPLELVTSFDCMTINVLVKTIFGEDIDSKESIAVSKELRLAIKYIFGSILMQLFLGVLPDWFPIPGERRYQQAIQKIRIVIKNLVMKCRKKEDKEDNLLSMMIHSVDDTGHNNFDEQELFDEALTVFLAGYDTTSTVLTWCFYLLMEHPHVFQKLQSEVDTILAGKLPTIEDLPKLSYTYRVIQETLRMYPPASFLTRQAKETDQLDGYCIPESTLILVSIYAIHHHPEVWENPDQFNPERFNPDRLKKHHRSAWIPFGDGQRTCIGKDYALMEAQLALAIIVQRYEISRVSGKVVKPKLSYIMKPQKNIFVTLKERLSQ